MIGVRPRSSQKMRRVQFQKILLQGVPEKGLENPQASVQGNQKQNSFSLSHSLSLSYTHSLSLVVSFFLSFLLSFFLCLYLSTCHMYDVFLNYSVPLRASVSQDSLINYLISEKLRDPENFWTDKFWERQNRKLEKG